MTRTQALDMAKGRPLYRGGQALSCEKGPFPQGENSRSVCSQNVGGEVSR